VSEQPNRPGRLYLPGIDAMRGFVVIIGMLFHANIALFKSGLLFVDVFGVLSGYLITRVLLGEHLLTGRIDLKRFYIARVRRLVPALVAVLVAVVLYARAFEPQVLWDLRIQTLAALGYVYNWYAIFSGGDYFESYNVLPIQHLWSLSLEEQFYIVWPVTLIGLLALVRRSGRVRTVLPYAFLAGAAASAVAAFAIFHGGDTSGTTDSVRAPLSFLGFEANRLMMVYMSTITRSGGFLVGAALAFWWQPDIRPPNSRRFDRTLDACGLLAVVAMFLLTNLQWFTPNVHEAVVNGGAVAVWVICVVLIMSMSRQESVWMQRLFVHKPLVRLGVVSYALYLYHWPVMQFYRKYPFKSIPLAFVLAAFAVCWVVAEVSQRYFERPIRRMGLTAYLATLRPAVRRAAVTVSSVAIAAAIVALVAAPRSTDALEQGIALSERDTAGLAQGETTEVLVIGDSISALMAAEYREKGYVVDAVVARSFAESSGMAEYLVSSGQVTDALVVHVGTNEDVSRDDLRRLLDATRSLRRIVVVTLWRPGWNLLEGNNANIRSMAAEYPNLVVADWHALAAQDPETFVMADGIHVQRGTGVSAYQSLIERAVEAPAGGIVMGPS